MEYILKSTAILTIFYLFYKIFLQRETFFYSIRSYFLIGIISALVVPLIILTKYIQIEPLAIPADLIFNESSTIAEIDTFNWTQLIFIAYSLGVLFFSLRFLWQLSSLFWFLYSHPKSKEGRYIFVKTTKNITPFSFFNFIVFNSDEFGKKDLDQILAHEKIHVNQLHSFDTIFSQLIAIAFWFNPIIWLYNKEIQKNLEFIADEIAQYTSPEKKKYQYLLLKTISTDYKMALTSNFYNTLIKKRIDMLHKNRSKRNNQFKFVFILPFLIAFIMVFNTRIVAQNSDTKNQNIQKVEKKILELIITKNNTQSDLENVKNKFLKEDVDVKFKGIKRNSNGEITGIKIDVSSKTANANFNTSSDRAIRPIKITFDSEGNSISIGNSNMHGNNEFVFFSDDHQSKENKTYFISSNDDGNVEKHVVKIGSNSKHSWFSSEGDSSKIHKVKIVKIDGDKEDNVWILEDGDKVKTKNIKVIELDEDGDKVHKIIIKKRGDLHEKSEFIIHSDDAHVTKKGNLIIIDSDGEQPLIIIDGKEISDGKMEDIDPTSIKSIEVIKGEGAVKDYGEKAKDGVIKITTKK